MKEKQVVKTSQSALLLFPRVVNIRLPKKGAGLLKARRPGLKKIVEENSSKLSNKDIESLPAVQRIIRCIVPKLQDE
jgi:hypothetical protein